MEEYEFKIPNILFLEGVKLSDYESPEDYFQRTVLESIEEYEIEKERDKIPTSFAGLKTWKKSTNLPCWNCSCKFNTIPIFIPTYIKYIDGELEMGVLGNFCNFSCAQKCLIGRFRNTILESKYSRYLRDAYKIFYGVCIDYIDGDIPDMFDTYEWGGNDFATKEDLRQFIRQKNSNKIDYCTEDVIANTWMDTLANELLDNK